ncbi:MAG: calcium-binding protein, partial [Pseudomonadota bacterium]
DSFTVSGGTLSGTADGAAGTDTLIGDSSYSITGADSGTSGSVTAFANIENLTGTANADSFTINGGTLSGTVDGAGGMDALIGDSSYSITGADSGTSGSVNAFTSIENLIGTGGSDSFTVSGGSLSGTVDGLAGTDTLAGDTSYSITGADSGTSGSVNAFANIDNLTGTTGDDTFTFLVGGSLSGLIDGLAQTTADTVDYSALSGLTLTLGIGFTDIENLLGGGVGFTLVNGSNWTITGADDGTVDGISFTNWEDVTGTAGDDTFTVNAAFSGVMNGGEGNDQFNLNDGVTTLTGGAGTDRVTLVSSFAVPGSMAITAEIIDDSGSGVVLGADTLTINGATAIGSSANPFGTDLSTLIVSNANGDAFITEINAIDLAGVDVGSSVFSLNAGGSITQQDTNTGINADSLITSSVGGTALNGANTVSSFNGSNTGSGNIAFNNSGTLSLAAINTAGNVTAVNSGDILLGQVNADGNTVDLTAAGFDDSILNNNGLDTNVKSRIVNLTAGFRIGESGNDITLDIDPAGEINLIFGAAQAYIRNLNQTPVSFSQGSVVDSVATAIAGAGRAQDVELADIGFVDWSLFSEDLSLFGVVEPGIKLPKDQVEDDLVLKLPEPDVPLLLKIAGNWEYLHTFLPRSFLQPLKQEVMDQ